MIQRPVAAAQPWSGGDRPLDEVHRVRDYLLERSSLREASDDRGGKRASRSMSRCGVQPRVGETSGRSTFHYQDVYDLVTGQVTTGNEGRTGAEFEQNMACARHLLGVSHLFSDERSGFSEIWCDDRGAGDEAFDNAALRVAVQQPIAGRRDHHGVEHVVWQTVSPEGVGHGGDDLDRAEHAAFHRERREIVGDGVDLADHELGRKRLPRQHAERVLSRHRGDDARAEDPELVERLQVGLDAGAASRIRAGDGQGDFHRVAARSFAARQGTRAWQTPP